MPARVIGVMRTFMLTNLRAARVQDNRSCICPRIECNRVPCGTGSPYLSFQACVNSATVAKRHARDATEQLAVQGLTMRLLSYNIHKGIGGSDRRYRLERIIEVIEGENPDLICLQEVTHNIRRSWYHDQPALLARHFKAVGH